MPKKAVETSVDAVNESMFNYQLFYFSIPIFTAPILLILQLNPKHNDKKFVPKK